MIDPTKTKVGYSRDSEGQWWFQTGVRPRVRCKIKTCGTCGEKYVISPYCAKASRFCSRACSQEAQRDKMRGRGEKAWQWKGGRHMQRGYVFIYKPEHPSCQGSGRIYVAEHRLVMEKKLGRVLKPNEYVHHINGVKTDNRPANLELIGGSEHAKRHWVSRKPPHCPTCTCDH